MTWHTSNDSAMSELPERTARAWVPVVMALLLFGCGGRDAVTVRLQTRPLPDEPATLRAVEAQVAGPLAGLSYKWFAVSGECVPQESGDPKTVFRFAEGARVDQVTLEVWRGAMRVARDEIKVRYDDQRARREQRQSPDARIEITVIPPAEPGGPASGADIAGKVSGKITAEHRIVIYARAYGAWYIQPEAHQLLPIQEDRTWASRIHTGGRYAALLVRREFEPISQLDMLPETNQYVLAIDVVDGAFKPQTNEPPGIRSTPK